MLDDGAAFLSSCMKAGSIGSILTVEHAASPEYWFQVYVCGVVHGDGSEDVSGELQAQIPGLENVGVSDSNCRERFARLLQSGWYEDEGNAVRIFGPFTEAGQLKMLLQTAADLLSAVYGFEDADWNIDCYQEG
jgi:hypothetical protein